MTTPTDDRKHVFRVRVHRPAAEPNRYRDTTEVHLLATGLAALFEQLADAAMEGDLDGATEITVEPHCRIGFAPEPSRG